MFDILHFGNRHQWWSNKTATGTSREGDGKCRADDTIWLQELLSAGTESVRLPWLPDARSSCISVDWQWEEIVRHRWICTDLCNGCFVACAARSAESQQCYGEKYPLFTFMLLIWQQEGHPACKNPYHAMSRDFFGDLGDPAWPVVSSEDLRVKQKESNCLFRKYNVACRSLLFHYMSLGDIVKVWVSWKMIRLSLWTKQISWTANYCITPTFRYYLRSESKTLVR